MHTSAVRHQSRVASIFECPCYQQAQAELIRGAVKWEDLGSVSGAGEKRRRRSYEDNLTNLFGARQTRYSFVQPEGPGPSRGCMRMLYLLP